MRKLVRISLLAVGLALSIPAAASAASGWVANPGTTFENGIVKLDSTGQAAGTSYENPDLDVAVEEGDTISFEWRSSDVACAGGVPRVFIQGGAFNTFDSDPAGEEACGTDPDGDGWFKVSQPLTGIADGTAGHTGIVNDNTSDPGTIEVRNLIIAGVAVLPLEGARQCKKGGWRKLGYRNQGQCVSSFNRNKHKNKESFGRSKVKAGKNK